MTGQHDEPLGDLFDAEGWHYGVKFHDGSIAHRWAGEGQRDRAILYLRALRTTYGNKSNHMSGTFTLMRRHHTGYWEEAPENGHIAPESPAPHTTCPDQEDE